MCESQEYVDSTMDDLVEEDQMEDKIHNVGVESFGQAYVYVNMSTDVETPLYHGSIEFTRLLTMLRLMDLKTIN